MKQAIAGVVAFDDEITVMIVYPSIAGAPGGIGKILGRLFNIQIGIKPLTIGNLIALVSAPLCAGLWIGRVLPVNRLPLIGTLSKKLGLAPQRYRITTRAILSEDAFDGSTIQETIALDSFDEVEIAIEAQSELEAHGIATKVVSMPSTETFDAQPEAYQDEVLGHSKVYASIEAGATYGWDKYVGRNGVKIGIDEFGASAPAKDLYKHFGVTKENLVSQIKAKL